MSTTRRLIKNFFSLTLAEFISRILSMFLYIYIANILGVTAFGELAFATSFTAFFNIFADFGLTMIGIREITREKDKMNEYGNNILVFQVLLVSLLLLILVIILYFLPISFSLKLLTFVFGLRMIPSAFDVSYIFQAFERMEYVLITRVSTQFIYLGLGLLLLLIDHNVLSIPIALFVGTSIGASLGFLFLRAKFDFHIHQSFFDFATVKRFTFMSFSIFSAAILAGIYNNLDAIMLQLYKNADQVGYYSASYKIINTIMVFTVFIGNTFFPLIASHFTTDIEKFRKHVLEFARSMGFISIPVTVGGFVYAKDIILLIYRKSNFINSVDSFKILIFLMLLSGIITLFGTILVAANYQRYNLYSVIVGTIANIIFNFLLIPRYGVVGASFSILFSQSAALIYLVGFYLIGMHESFDTIIAFFAKPLIASAAMLIVILAIKNLFIGIILGGLVYIVTMFLIKGIPGNIVEKVNSLLPFHHHAE